MRAVHVVGGGPAGVMAAFAAMREGAGVRIFEKFAFPRHKVCGEFLSPAILPDRKSTRLNSSHANISYAVFCLKKTHNDLLHIFPLARVPRQSFSQLAWRLR